MKTPLRSVTDFAPVLAEALGVRRGGGAPIGHKERPGT